MLWRLFQSGREVERYVHDDAWALVTGASDGIGKALADELLGRGFNVFVHGRNAEKLGRVRDELAARHPTRAVETVACDAGAVDEAMVEGIVRQVGGRALTLFVNNLGATERRIVPLSAQSWADVEATVNIGVRFAAQLTRALLPVLAAHAPAAALQVGSSSARFGAPFVPIYAATKGFLRTLTRCVELELRADAIDVQVQYIDVGEVRTTAHDVPLSFAVVSSESMACAIVDAIGCGSGEVTPHWHHELINYVTACLPPRLLDYIVTQTMQAKRDDLAVNKKTD